VLNLKTIEFPVEASVDDGNRSEVTQRLAGLVRAEYAEMPGLSVTLAQAQRLWGVDERTCRRVLDALIARGILRRTTKGCYVRVAT
jgi:Fic family protein